VTKSKKTKISAQSGKRVKRKVVRVRKKVRAGKKNNQNKSKQKESPEEDYTKIYCGIHDECYKLSNLIEVLAEGYSSYHGGS
jgi:hypothetical protein